ncbi:hypothetical protein BBD39_06745 [Arsenophonus endosymbiont of Bemisia tabaci Asia II 3]|nr:hypothetical protein BBD39_06745 [Arsenophonus endosymbiont of Bemisia tabaci Asia II 3]
MFTVQQKRKTIFQRLNPGIAVFHNEKVLKIIRLRNIKLTEKGLMYQFDVDDSNGVLMGESGTKISIIKE